MGSLLLLRQYTTRVLLESRVGVDVEQAGTIGDRTRLD